jgi:PAS domain S-box-containing protein
LRPVRQDTTTRTASSEVLGIPFATSRYPMWVYDQDTHIFLDVNDAAVQQYGYTRQEFLAMTILDIRSPADIPAVLRQARDPRPQAGEKWRHQAKNGNVFPVAITTWKTTFRGRQAELVLARPEVDKVGVN